MALHRRKPPPPRAEADALFLPALVDDTEDAPWLVMGDLQFDATSSFKHSLRTQTALVCGHMLPIRYRVRGSARGPQLAPDCFVALMPDRPRESYDLEVEAVFPAFVLEVVSLSSVKRDAEDKLRTYDMLGTAEYVLFAALRIGLDE